MAKRCPEDFNPWPPFVDIFASVILVMLLFLLITIVNIGYYAQFKFKTSYTASVTTKEPIVSAEQSKVTSSMPECKPIPIQKEKIPENQAFSFHKVLAPAFDEAKNSLFSGGQADGSAVSYAANKDQKKFTNQKFIKKNLILTIEFEDKEIFLNSNIKRKIKVFISNINRRSKRAEFSIFVSDPKNIISSTLSKQISLGRILNVKNIVKRANIQAKNIKINLQKEIPTNSLYGAITIKVHIP